MYVLKRNSSIWVATLVMMAAPAVAREGASGGDAPAQPPAVPTSLSPEDSGGTSLKEVVITAQKRKQTLDTTPIAVTALSGAQLAARGVTAMTDLASNTPDLQVHTVGVDGYFGVAIRGISNLVYTPDANPAVAKYIDGVYVDLPYGLTDELFDLDRIEILRGPQGTLYGRNSTGGDVNIITAAPVPHLDANWDASYGNYNDLLTHAMVNVPASSTLSIRAAGMLHQNNGYFDTDGTTSRNYGSADDWAARLTGLWTPISQFRWQLSIDSFLSQGTPGESVETGPNGRPLNGLSPYHQPVNSDPPPDNYLRSNSLRSRIDWDIGNGFSLSYIGGYQDLLQHYDWATTGQVGAPANPAYQQYAKIASKSQSQEVDFAYDSRRFKNVLGATYFHDAIEEASNAIYPILGLDAKFIDWDIFKESWGAFDQVTYTVFTNLRATGGVRYSHDAESESEYTSLYCAMSS
ncbi:MAG: TonB-dependent receptor, partial [Steroidobacteraceae bacterium]